VGVFISVGYPARPSCGAYGIGLYPIPFPRRFISESGIAASRDDRLNRPGCVISQIITRTSPERGDIDAEIRDVENNLVFPFFLKPFLPAGISLAVVRMGAFHTFFLQQPTF